MSLSPQVTIVDYGMGNLFSVRRALEVVGASVVITSDAKEIESAEYLILPGVGAFADGMNGLTQRNLISPLKAFAKTQKPFLGICLGMQMMLEVGEEFGRHDGLGFIKGLVKVIAPKDRDGQILKVPHIGWNELHYTEAFPSWSGTLLDGLTPAKDAVYFVHSYAAQPIQAKNILAYTRYGGHDVVAVIREGNMTGCQFHLERSGPVGLKLLKNFLRS